MMSGMNLLMRKEVNGTLPECGCGWGSHMPVQEQPQSRAQGRYMCPPHGNPKNVEAHSRNLGQQRCKAHKHSRMAHLICHEPPDEAGHRGNAHIGADHQVPGEGSEVRGNERGGGRRPLGGAQGIHGHCPRATALPCQIIHSMAGFESSDVVASFIKTATR